VFAAKTLAEQLHAGLAARGLTCVRVQVQVTWADGGESSRLWRHDGLLAAAGVADRVRWQLDGWRAGPGDGHYAQGGIGCSGWCPIRWSAPPGTSSRSG